jgi:hypothetical protein
MTTTASIFTDVWDDLVKHDRQSLFVVLVAFLLSFGFIRLSARMIRSPRFSWWPGSVVSDSGVHLHHLVWGICLMMGGGALGFAFFHASPGREICAAIFGVGAGLTIDEFALWVYLDDVYWAREGRSSIDAAVLAAVAMLLVLFGARPFSIGGTNAAQVAVTVAFGLLVIGLAATCFAKYRLLHGAIGLFILPVSVYGALRIGKPNSTWAKRFYGTRNPRKQARAEHRFRPERRTNQLKERFRDAIGGSTEDRYEAKLAQHAATGEAAAAVHERAAQLAAGERAEVDAPVEPR